MFKTSSLPYLVLCASCKQHPLPYGNNKSRILSQRYKLARRHKPCFWLLPSNQGLDAYGRACLNINLRLIVEHKLLFLNRHTELIFKLKLLSNTFVHTGGVQLITVPALFFCLVQGYISVL